ncbi:MarR family winged helix-turn-helix transcriptional regulator [Actinacidiphila acididurans]|uniref:MarR family transcriptional regulator n=1 Tax=Actinacidiphila acididurans TaxID=2784346 RepID=A0ABS2U147_9ACTN|nr:MarR family transcriptional regulator [Actinacidiphila acididurans]MBM9509305.1 MarR family transcriptional regulator [Actinacidiphila acididurans]
MTDDGWLNPDELRVYRAFNRSWQALNARLDDDLETDLGLPRAYFDVLWRLRRAPGRAMRMSELAAETESKPSRITHATSRLEAMGLVRRVAAEGDRRGYLAVLTDQGLTVAEQAAPRFARAVREHFLDLLTPAMREHMTEIGAAVLRENAPDRTLEGP